MAKKWFSLFGLYLIKKFWFSVDNSYINDGNGDNKDDGIDNGDSDSSDGNYVKIMVIMATTIATVMINDY